MKTFKIVKTFSTIANRFQFSRKYHSEMAWLFGGDDPVAKEVHSVVTTIKTSQLHEEKLLAMKELEKLSKMHPFEVGRRGLSCILEDILMNHSSISIETTRLCIDILMHLLLPPENEHEMIEHEINNNGPNEANKKTRENGKMYYESNLELFLKPSNLLCPRLKLLIDLLSDDYNEYFAIRYNVIQILTILLLYKSTQHKIRNELVNIFGAMNRFSELLGITHNNDNSHVNNNQNIYLRQPTIVLLTHLCTNDESIQKAIAFNGAFEKLLSIMSETCDINNEDDSDAARGARGGAAAARGGGVTNDDVDDIDVSMVDDCLNLMTILLSQFTNQKYFVEIRCVPNFQVLINSLTKHLINNSNGRININNLNLLSKMIDTLFNIAKGTGYLENCQNELTKLMKPLLNMFSKIYSFSNNDNNNNNTIDKLIDISNKCLILLEIMIYGNLTNQNQFLSSKIRNEYAFLFFTRLSIIGSNNEFFNDMGLKIHCCNVVKCLLYNNRQLQGLLTQRVLNARLVTKHVWQTFICFFFFLFFVVVAVVFLVTFICHN